MFKKILSIFIGAFFIFNLTFTFNISAYCKEKKREDYLKNNFIPSIYCFSLYNNFCALTLTFLYSLVSPKYIQTDKNGDCPFVFVIELT